MSRWFRMYDDVVDDPKVQRLPADLFRAWINLLCIACKNGGILPSADDIAFTLRMPSTSVSKILGKLIAAELIDETETGFEPHNWSGRQHKNDVSTERVKRFRKRNKKPDETVSRNAPEADTDTEADVARDAIVSLRTALTRAFEAANSPSVPDTSRAAVWISQGYRPDLCIAVVSEGLSRKKSISSLSYFDNAIREAHQKVAPPTAPPPPTVLVADEIRWKARLDELRAGSPWRDQWGEPIGAAGCLCPKHLADEFVSWCRARKIEVAA